VDLSLQQIIDDLAERLGRPTVLEDHTLRLIAYSAHDQAIDDVRETSILRRHATPEVAAWLTDLGVRQARRPVRVPGNRELHMLPRVCIPVVFDQHVLAYLWFIDADGTMGVDEIELCGPWVDQLAVQLHRDQMSGALASARLAEALEAVLSASPGASEAARGLLDAGDFSAPEGAVVAVVQVHPSDLDGSADIERALAEAMAAHQRSARRLPTLSLIRRDHGVVFIASPDDDNTRLNSWVGSLRDTVNAHLDKVDGRLCAVAGIGGHQERLEDAAQSFREARMAVAAATAFSGLGESIHWSRLGVGQVLVKLAMAGEDAPVVHPGLHRLLRSPEALPLVETLEMYLDVAGNVQLTSKRLNLHRTSLYYRLQRVEELAGTDLKDGMERLALHFTLKVARMTGEYVPRRHDDALPSEPARSAEPKRSVVRQLDRAAGPDHTGRIPLPAQAAR